MDLLCDVRDRSIIENEPEYMNYQATLRKENDQNLYKKYTFNNVILAEVNKIL